VTSYVQAQKTAGATEVDFAVQQPVSSNDGPAVLNSKEAATSKPHLMVTQLDTVTPPGTPSGLGATAASSQVTLTWPAVSGATSYDVYRGTAAGSETFLANVTATTYTDNAVTNGATYFYYIKAKNSGGTSGASNEVSATPTGGGAPVAAPTFSAAAGSYPVSKSITITTATSGATIRYTTDGSAPTASTGTVYSAAVVLNTNTTLKAIAYKAGMTDSTVTSAAYTILQVLSFEAENTFTVASGATAASTADAAASNGFWKALSSTATGQYYEFGLTGVVAGTYQVAITYKSNNNRAKCSVKVDGTVLGAEIDQYAANAAYVTVNQGTLALAAGTRTLRFTTTTKNAASGNWNLGIDKIVLTPQ
jgi:hypothetical protein